MGRGGGPGAAASDRGATACPGGDGGPAPWVVVGRGWSVDASRRASDDARGELWATGARAGGVCDGPDGGEAAGRAGHRSAVGADGREGRGDWRIGTGEECRVGRASGGGADRRAASAGAQCC